MPRPHLFIRHEVTNPPTVREWLLLGLLIGAIIDKIICCVYP